MEVSPKKVFLVNLIRSSKTYCSKHLLSLSSLAFLLALPSGYRAALKARHSLFKHLKSREEVFELLERHRELSLRMQIIGFDTKSGIFQCIHRPLFSNQKASTNRNVGSSERAKDPMVLSFALSGVEYPLIERCVKEI